MEIWFGTKNKGKLVEAQSLLSDHNLKSALDLSFYAEPNENAASFLENARIKAKSIRAVAPQSAWAIAEDSGLEVKALNNLPGVHSRRYAGPKATDAENTTKLLKMLQLRAPNQRAAAFVCTLVAISPNGQEHVFKGELFGEIGKQMRGQGGFGYDSVFIPMGQVKTLAEMTPQEKNEFSHRGQAFRAFRQLLINS